MRSKRWILAFAVIGIFALAAPSFSMHTDIVKSFMKAYLLDIEEEMAYIVKKNKDRIPAEIEGLMDEALATGASEDERRGNFAIAERMAAVYKDVSGDAGPLKGVKKRYIDSLLSMPVRAPFVSGAHVVEIPQSSEAAKNIFAPDNIAIKAGDKVRWVNKDAEKHVLSAVPFVGMGGIEPADIEPGQIREFTFAKPGEYYYMCYIHRWMIGKVTVEE